MVGDRYIGVALPLFGMDGVVDGLATTDVVVCMLLQVRWLTIVIVGECMATISGMMADDVRGRDMNRSDKIC